jgi:hypothetical protein
VDPVEAAYDSLPEEDLAIVLFTGRMSVDAPVAERPDGTVRSLVHIMAAAVMQGHQLTAMFFTDDLELAPETAALRRGEHAPTADHTDMYRVICGLG